MTEWPTEYTVSKDRITPVIVLRERMTEWPTEYTVSKDRITPLWWKQKYLAKFDLITCKINTVSAINQTRCY